MKDNYKEEIQQEFEKEKGWKLVERKLFGLPVSIVGMDNTGTAWAEGSYYIAFSEWQSEKLIEARKEAKKNQAHFDDMICQAEISHKHQNKILKQELKRVKGVVFGKGSHQERIYDLKQLLTKKEEK